MEKQKKVKKPETEEEKKKRIAKISKGVKKYHSCCQKANCGSKNKMVKKEKNTIKKYLTKPKKETKPKPKPKATPKPKRKFDTKMLKKKRDEIEESRDGLGQFGELYYVMIPERCKEIIKMSKNLIKLKNNGYKRNTEVNFHSVNESISKFDGRNYKSYKIPKIEVVIRFFSYLINNKEQTLIDVKKDCGEQELLFLEKAFEIMEKDSKLIKDTIIKQRSKQIKNEPLPKF